MSWLTHYASSAEGDQWSPGMRGRGHPAQEEDCRARKGAGSEVSVGDTVHSSDPLPLGNGFPHDAQMSVVQERGRGA